MTRYSPIPQELFILNRQRLAAKLLPGSLAILNANDLPLRNADTHGAFRQNSDLFYLSGIDQEETVLALFPNCPKGKEFEEILFLKKTSELIRIWEGYKLTMEEAAALSGVGKIYWLEDKDLILNELIILAENVYLNTNENDRAHIEYDSRDMRYIRELQRRYPLHRYHRLQPLMKHLRMIKSEHEINTMRRAIAITEQAFRRVLAFTKPGVWEYEVEAEIIHEFIRSGANDHAYRPIIAGGGNSCVLHYNDNSRQLKNGDILLMDFGAEYANYAADLTRCIPVNGTFSERQKAVYQAVLRVMKGAKEMLVPGNAILEYHKSVGLLMEEELIGLGLLKREEVKAQDPDKPLYKRYFMHGTSHHLGLDVHDLAHRYAAFEAGMVLTCEPGIYIPEEGIGIRIENDILITSGEPVDLMASIPIEVEEIEALMQVAPTHLN